MKKRSIGKMFLLFIVTIGIYRLYWFAKTRKEMMAIKPVKIPSIWIFAIPLVIFFIVLALFVSRISSLYEVSGTIRNRCGFDDNSLAYDKCEDDVIRESSAGTGIILLLYGTFFLFLPIAAWWIWQYSKAVEEVTNEKMSFAMTMLVALLVPDGIDILILQDAFNKVAESSPGTVPAVPAST